MKSVKETEIGRIPSSWQVLSVSQLVEQRIIEKPIDGNHGEKHPKGDDFIANGIPFIMATDIKGGKIDLLNCKYISSKRAESLDKGFAKPGDVLLTHKASLGRTAIIPTLQTPYLILTPQVTYYRVIDNNRLDSRYLKYYFDSPAFQETFVNHGDSGSTRAYVGITAQRDLPILLPPLPEQRAIAGVLSSLDDKIDLLQRQNKTLEAMAETMFRQWFVEEADEGWEEGKLGDLVTVYGGSTPKTDIADFWDGEINWTSPRDVTNLEQLYLFETERKITKKGLQQISSGLLPKGALLMSSRAPVGALAFAEIPLAINQGYAGIICDKGYSREYIYLWLKLNMEYVRSHANGSTFQEISKSTLRELNVIIPSKKKLLLFQEMISIVFDKNRINVIQARCLEKLRDTLLSGLMNGEACIFY